MNMFISLFSFPLYILSVMMSICSSSMLTIWVFMEISTVLFISFMFIMNNKHSSTVKYYIIQAMSSGLVLITFLGSVLTSGPSFLVALMLMVKIGVVPFHGWVVSVLPLMNSSIFVLLSSAQKIIPLCLMMKSFTEMLWVFMLTNMIVSFFYLLLSDHMVELLTYSSIFNTSWMMASKSLMVLFLFIFTYMVGLFMVFSFLGSAPLKNKSSYFHVRSYKFAKYGFMLGMMTLSGMPPFAGFLGKYLILFGVMSVSEMVALIFLLASVVPLYAYLSMMSTKLLTLGSECIFKTSEVSLNSFYMVISMSLFPLLML